LKESGLITAGNSPRLNGHGCGDELITLLYEMQGRQAPPLSSVRPTLAAMAAQSQV
jgi:hypothetical protein